MKKLAFCTLLLGTAASAAQAAPSAGCAALQGFSTSLLEVRVNNQITDLPLSAGEVVSISGSAMTQSGNQPSDGWYVSDPVAGNPGAFGYAPLSPVYGPTSSPFTQTFIVPAAGMLSFGISETGAVYTDILNLSITCALPALDLTIVAVANAAQRRAIISSLQRNYASRFGGAPVADGAFVSSKGDAAGKDGVNVWSSLSGRTYSNGQDGNAVGLTFGADRFVGAETLLGVMLGRTGERITDDAGAESDADAAMLGLYAARAFGKGVLVDGYVAYARVSYDVDGATFDTDRALFGLSASGRIPHASGVFQPRARVDAAWEDFPADVTGLTSGRSRTATAALGARFDWAQPIAASGLKPYASLDVEWTYIRDTADASSTFAAPRLGLGVSGLVGQGELSAGIDIGRVAENVNDAGLTVSYDLRF